MNIIIRADRRIGKQIIGESYFKGQKIIKRIVSFLSKIGQKKVYVASNKKYGIKGTKDIPLSKINSIKNKVVMDLKYIYDGYKLERLIKKGKQLKKAIITENKTLIHLKNFGCISEEREWNPISGCYGVPMGIRLGFWLSKTNISPNFITLLNLFLGILVSVLVLIGGRLNLFIFGIWVIIFHLLDAADGKLAKFTGKTTSFGRWLDGGGDKFIMNFWFLIITVSLYLKSGSVIFLFVGLILLFGALMYNYLLLTSTAYFRDSNFDYVSSSRIKRNPVIRLMLVFINMDIQIHFIIVSALLGRFELLIIFYSIYFNLMWMGYFLFYFAKYLREKDIKEV
ncbi:MAG: CDP-alcohol phosphatidyltransferase family protein [Nanoarchaeota archaeon]|nr:CDP-alcohol phosphatidyltransferase family protein [Nanoarchaeota archaeon]